jgi:GntR family transcriptional repressor for pyruvate dehydrogenase complex
MTRRPITGLVDRVYREILGSIIRGELTEGGKPPVEQAVNESRAARPNASRWDKLPTEQALTERFTASRPTIREALSRLRADGIITSRQGSGTYVTRQPDPDIPRFAPLESISDLRRCFDFRIAVESGAAALAAEQADEGDLTEISRTFVHLNTVVAEQSVGAQEDFEFHLAIAKASKNQFFVSAISSMQEQLLVSMNLMRNLSLLKSGDRQKKVQAEHEAILLALQRRDAEAAAQAMRAHLEGARDRMFGT